ncbi:lipopolysaccharide heptosyltransferase I [Sulfuricurvum sp. IAE1]|uniref:lipopolysaccharide heptosyltransferase I n=1 Tax=Sulfuricurvum sp. IAE1 TaxID=2546102 RepID=UPI001053373B|nr:lipopolysaccharide heptosyltransferase I [Sulfuricurvum sp. IAE1]MDD3770399.1 lipopolysaccharide heptosyltransferase I [Sulfuricurvum sp.]TDA69285.1 lipopolysaccharide heptosyltransferase I [Sulfuricurvum sp. IAE1]
MKSPCPKIAIVRLSALGDIVNTAVVLQIIKARYPGALIDWFVEEAFAPLLEGHPLLNETVAVPIKRIKKNRDFGLLLHTLRDLKRRAPYDRIIDAQGLLKSAFVASLLKGPVHGFDRLSARESAAAWFYDTASSIPYDENVVRRNVRVVTEALGIPFSEAQIQEKTPLFQPGPKPVLSPSDRPAVACVIGASWPSKCYPKELFAKVCSGLEGMTCHLIWGSETERSDAEWIARHAPNALIAPKMSLKELTGFIAQCDLTIGNDTGPTHMAWAMNRASITLFGPTNERMIYPTAMNVAIQSSSNVNILKIDRNDFSIREIDPDLIVQKAKELL